MCTYVPSLWGSLPLPCPPSHHPFTPSQSPELSCLGCRAASHDLPVLLMTLCIFQCLSLNSSCPALPACPHVWWILLGLFSCPARMFICTIFLGSMSVLIYNIWFSLSNLPQSVWQILVPSTLLQMTQFHSSLSLSIIPLCVCVCVCKPYLLTHSSVNGHLVCFHVLAMVNTDAVKIVTCVSFWIMVFSGYIPSSGVTGLRDSSMFIFVSWIKFTFNWI